MSQSEIAYLRTQIEREHEAACWARTGLAAGQLQHRFIHRRMREIDAHHQRLGTLIGEQASRHFVNEVFEKSPHQQNNEEAFA